MNIIPLRPTDPEAAARLVADIPEPLGGFDQEALELLIADLRSSWVEPWS